MELEAAAPPKRKFNEVIANVAETEKKLIMAAEPMEQLIEPPLSALVTPDELRQGRQIMALASQRENVKALQDLELRKQFLASQPDLAPGTTTFMRGGKLYTRQGPAFATDPLVRDIGGRVANVGHRIGLLVPDLTQKQAIRLTKRWKAITLVQKGKHKMDEKVPTTAQLDKVLFLAYELHAQRRSAQFTAQRLRARRERHALQQHKKTVIDEAGNTINYNQRHYKKLAGSRLREVALSAGVAEARQLRNQISTRNKARRVAIAQKRGTKVNPKDLTVSV